MKALSRFCWTQRSCFEIAQIFVERRTHESHLRYIEPAGRSRSLRHGGIRGAKVRARDGDSESAIGGGSWDRSSAEVKKAAEAAHFAFRQVRVIDFDVLDLKRQLPLCVMVLDELVAAGHGVYVHCTAGVTRSPTVRAAYLHWKLNWPLEKALNHLHAVRNCSPLGDVIRRCQPILL